MLTLEKPIKEATISDRIKLLFCKEQSYEDIQDLRDSKGYIEITKVIYKKVNNIKYILDRYTSGRIVNGTFYECRR